MSVYTNKPKKCPKCGNDSIAEILYGMVSPCDEGLNKKLDTGEIFLGGCCIDNDSPQWHCNSCDHEWGKFEDSNFGDHTNFTPPGNSEDQDPPRY